jgi:type VI secretion system secreted protein VgrG
VSACRLAGVDSKGKDQGRARVELTVVPRFALLGLRRQSRIFQDKTVREVVVILLDEWKIKHSFQLIGTYKPRPYVTQHGETDYEFVRRILAMDGIGYFIAASAASASLKEAPEVVFFDAASAYAPLPGGGAGDTKLAGTKPVLRHAHSNFEQRAEDVVGFALRRELAPKSAILGDFDFRRPGTALHANSHYGGPAGPAAVEQGERFEAYFYADRQEYESGWPEVDEERAQVALEQLRVEATVGQASTRSARVLPGHVFTLEAHAIDALNQDYVVTRVEHQGTAPDLHGGGPAASYEASFSVVPAVVTYRPTVERAARAVHGAETATVVGPKGEDIYTDAFGRVKVRFHWDQEGKGDEHSSCWLRVAEAWAGQRWGTQFVPRVGMEVLVTYLGGDPDRPVVTGCLYNTTHPTPFRLPADKYKSGLVTHSSDGSGSNELSFQDLAGEEKVAILAKRDLDVTVGRDATTQIRGDESHAVTGSQTVNVHGSVSSTVGGASTVTVAGAHTQAVKGDHKLVVAGALTQAVAGAMSLSVAGDLIANVAGSAMPAVGGGAELKLAGDAVLRTAGHLVAIVGAPDALTSATVHVQGGSELYSAGATEIIAEEGITLRVGKSMIRILRDAIEIDTDTLIMRARRELLAKATETVEIKSKNNAHFEASKALTLLAEAAAVKLTRDARIDGDLVKLNCSPDHAEPGKRAEKKKKPTLFSLVDENGKPMAGKRVLVLCDDGTERASVLDKDGKVELELDDSGDVVFPDVSKPQKV